jgi:hypothetical protein
MPSADPFAFPRVHPDPEVMKDIIRAAGFAADHEAMKPGPVSRIRNPDGSPQGETAAEFTARIVTAAVMHVVEIGLLTVPEDIATRLDDWLPVSREDSLPPLARPTRENDTPPVHHVHDSDSVSARDTSPGEA